MNRDDVRAILDNSELDRDAMVIALMELNGADINGWRAKYDTLKTQYQTALSERDSRADYDAIVQERDTLLAEKADRAMTDRFSAVIGGRKFVNTYTADGVRKSFADAVALPENEGKTDEEIYASIADGNEAAWFENPVKVSMTPSAGKIDAPDELTAYMDQKYAGNPFYKK